MSNREDLGYTKPTLVANKQQSGSPNPKLTQQKRLEIRQWAEEKAYESAKTQRMVRDDNDFDRMRQFDAFISSETIRFERLAYNKIRESGSLS